MHQPQESSIRFDLSQHTAAFLPCLSSNAHRPSDSMKQQVINHSSQCVQPQQGSKPHPQGMMIQQAGTSADQQGNQPQDHCQQFSQVAQEGTEKLLWWPVDHITLQKERLAVGSSCYVITGHCVLCRVDDELDMVECSKCKRFTHFQCTVPRLQQPPEVCQGCLAQIVFCCAQSAVASAC